MQASPQDSRPKPPSPPLKPRRLSPPKLKTEAEETRPNTDAAKPRTAKRQGQILPPPFGLPASPPLSDKQRKLEKEMVHLVSLNLVPPARASPTSFIFKHPSAYGADDSARLKDSGRWRKHAKRPDMKKTLTKPTVPGNSFAQNFQGSHGLPGVLTPGPCQPPKVKHASPLARPRKNHRSHASYDFLLLRFFRLKAPIIRIA